MFAEIKNVSVYYHKSHGHQGRHRQRPRGGRGEHHRRQRRRQEHHPRSRWSGSCPSRAATSSSTVRAWPAWRPRRGSRRASSWSPKDGSSSPICRCMTNLKLGATLRRDRAGIAESLEYVFELFPRLKERLKQNAGTLSGGEQQMLAIGRGLMANPRLLCLDEPSVGLAPIVVEQVGERDQGDQQARHQRPSRGAERPSRARGLPDRLRAGSGQGGVRRRRRGHQVQRHRQEGLPGRVGVRPRETWCSDMQYRRMGKSGLKVSAITLGTLWFGSKVDEATARPDRRPCAGRRHQLRRHRRHLRQGPLGHARRGDRPRRSWARALKGRRQSVVLATKVAALTGPGANDRGLSRKHIVEGLHESLRRLQTDYIDIYYLHEPDYTTPLEESLDTLNDLVRQGKILYIGLSNYYAWQVCKALWHADKKGLAGVDCIQMVYNLVARDAELEMTRLCEAEGIGINVWGALAGGMLSGKFLEYDPDQAAAAGRQALPVDVGRRATSTPWPG